VAGKRVATVLVMGVSGSLVRGGGTGGRGGVGTIVEPERRWGVGVPKTVVCWRVGKEGRGVEREGGGSWAAGIDIFGGVVGGFEVGAVGLLVDDGPLLSFVESVLARGGWRKDVLRWMCMWVGVKV